MTHLFRRTTLAASILLALNTPLYSPQVLAQAPPSAAGDPAGSEFQVNTHITGVQNNPSVAMDADGDYVIAWQSLFQQPGGEGYGIYAQRYQADGTPAGNEFLVNTFASAWQTSSTIAMDADGDFVIAWDSRVQDGDSYGVYAQRFQADGQPAGVEFRVNTSTVGSQMKPKIAMDADGDFVVVWKGMGTLDTSSYGIYAQRYEADGTPAGLEFLANTYTTGAQNNPSVAMDADGDFVIAWDSSNLATSNVNVYAQRYQADGTPVGVEFKVSSQPGSGNARASIAMDSDGDFVVAWDLLAFPAGGGLTYDIYAQRYQADGTPAGGEVRVTDLVEYQYKTNIAMDADGDFIISWVSSNGQDGEYAGVYAQRFQADGQPAGNQFLVNTVTAGSQEDQKIAMDADGDFVIAWESPDSDSIGIYTQRYRGAGNFAPNVDLNLVVQDDTDPVAPGSSFVYSLITTNNGTGIAMDVNLSGSLPAGLSYVSNDGASAGWGCTLSGSTINCNKPFMTVGEVNNISVTVTANTIGTLSNTATATAGQTDVNALDNTDTETTEVTTEVTTEATASGGGGGGISSFNLFMLLLTLPLWIRRRWLG
jgi:uncharacterized repeat protein (TIGR01451 family)